MGENKASYLSRLPNWSIIFRLSIKPNTSYAMRKPSGRLDYHWFSLKLIFLDLAKLLPITIPSFTHERVPKTTPQFYFKFLFVHIRKEGPQRMQLSTLLTVDAIFIWHLPAGSSQTMITWQKAFTVHTQLVLNLCIIQTQCWIEISKQNFAFTARALTIRVTICFLRCYFYKITLITSKKLQTKSF